MCLCFIIIDGDNIKLIEQVALTEGKFTKIEDVLAPRYT